MSAGKLPGSGMCLIFKAKWNHERLILLWKIVRFRAGRGKSPGHIMMG